MSILLGIAIMGVGFLMIFKTEHFLKIFGRSTFFEKNLGSEGGSRAGYNILGIIFILIGILIATGSGEALLYWIASPILKFNTI